MRRGSVLLVALSLIAVLSIMVFSFAMEARLNAGINVYVRERNRVNRLIEPAQALVEIILCGYKDVAEETEDENIDELLEEDRWLREKRALKSGSKCVVGPLVLDPEATAETIGEFGTVKIEIEPSNAGSGGVINVNRLSKDGGDARYQERWWMILRMCGVPQELSTPKDGTIQLWNILTASWNDWRDEDDTVTAIDGDEAGAENKWYEEYEEDEDIDDEDKKRPRQGKIPDVREMANIRGFREYPEVLTGGVINPWERGDEQITVKGVASLFTTEGPQKINVNNTTVDVLMTIPGVFDIDRVDDENDEDVVPDAKELAEAIIAAKNEKPDYSVANENAGEWPFKDWQDLVNRLSDVTDLDIGNEAEQYFEFSATDTALFNVTIVGSSMDMERRVRAQCYVKDKKVRYVKWEEDPRIQ